LDPKWPVLELESFFDTLPQTQRMDIDLQEILNMMDIVPVGLGSKEPALGLATMLDDVMELHWT